MNNYEREWTEKSLKASGQEGGDMFVTTDRPSLKKNPEQGYFISYSGTSVIDAKVQKFYQKKRNAYEWAELAIHPNAMRAIENAQTKFYTSCYNFFIRNLICLNRTKTMQQVKSYVLYTCGNLPGAFHNNFVENIELLFKKIESDKLKGKILPIYTTKYFVNIDMEPKKFMKEVVNPNRGKLATYRIFEKIKQFINEYDSPNPLTAAIMVEQGTIKFGRGFSRNSIQRKWKEILLLIENKDDDYEELVLKGNKIYRKDEILYSKIENRYIEIPEFLCIRINKYIEDINLNRMINNSLYKLTRKVIVEKIVDKSK